MMMNEVCAGQGAARPFIGIGRGALVFLARRARASASALAVGEARTLKRYRVGASTYTYKRAIDCADRLWCNRGAP